MARIRTIKPEFFRHEQLFEAERKSGLPLRIAFAGLWTAADREGRFRWQPRSLKLDCLPYDDIDFSLVLDALAAHGMIVKYTTPDGEFGFIPSWHKHQHINQREAQSTLPAPTDENTAQVSARTCAHIPARGEGKGREGKGNDIGAVAHATRPTLDEKFQEFWKAYPRRQGANPKAPARKAFDAAVKSGVEPETIIAAVKAGVGFDTAKIGTEYIPQAIKWLRDRRWEDYAPEPTNGHAVSQAFISIESPQWGALQARWRDAKHSQTGPPKIDRGGVTGWWFPVEWMQSSQAA